MNRKKFTNVKDINFKVGAAAFFLILAMFGIIIAVAATGSKPVERTGSVLTDTSAAVNGQASAELTSEPDDTAVPVIAGPEITGNSESFPAEWDAEYAILLDTETNEIVRYKNYNKRMNPASLTKVMTLIVAVENIKDLSDTVLITADMVDPMYDMDASLAGFAVGETPTLEQVLYGVILPSGADASLAAAVYTAGSEAGFVELMNLKAQEMGLKNTHFTNVIGLHNEQHYSTAEDMAVILEYAVQNDFCRKVLSTYEYEIPPTELNPEGIKLTSTVFSRMTGTEMPGVTIQGGKTGYTDEAGQCLETFAEINGKIYIMVLGGGTTKWNVVYDTLSGYSIYCAGGQAYIPPEVPAAE